MKIKKLWLGCLMVFLFAQFPITAQNIGGTVNTYTNVTNIAGLNITVGSAAGFVVCDRVMIIQMKGANITTTNTATFGQINAYNDAGNYEFANIASIAGNVITLTSPLTQTYTVTGAVQLIRVPVYTNPNITATITCPNWNGVTGGVVVFESTGPVTFNANIDVSGRGFVGGAMIAGGFGCSNANYATGIHGKKGEGIAVAPAGFDAHRAPLANGGGGSSPGNCGAAGGGNYGAGGRGGNEYSGCGATGIFGMGGLALTTVTNKAFLGGGGGGGFRDNGQPCAAGANGGGIVMINAPSVSGNGFSILANGSTVTLLTRDEGAGAGGAGGSVYLRVPTFTTALNVNVSGGGGGNIQNTIFTGAAHGPGGGGGGGYAWVTSAAMPANLAVTSTGGNAGLIQHAGAWFNTTYSAANGANGTTLFNLNTIPVSLPQNFPSPNLGPDTVLCGVGPITLQLDTVYNSYLWSDGSTGSTLNAATTGLYWVEVPVGCGVFERDSINVTISNPLVNLGPDQNLCSGDSILFDAGPGFTSYAWNTGSINSSVYGSIVGTYSVTVTDAVGCTATDMADVLNVFPLPNINLGPDTTQCGGSVLLNAGAGFTNYLWQDASMANSLNASTTGTYWVQITDANNCMNADTIDVTINPVPVPNLGPDISFCFGQNAVLDPGVFNSYAWSTTEITQTITVSTAGSYTVTVTNASGCTASDVLTVQNVYPLPQPNLGADQIFCQGNSATLSPGVFTGYLWSNASINSSIQVSNSGTFYVQVTDANACVNSDTINITVNTLPIFDLGVDFHICPGDEVTITPNGPVVPVTYLWSDGSTNSSLVLYDVGSYYLIVTDNNSCNYSDTVNILIDCPPTIYVPNAFTPNDDGINPQFMAYGTNIKEFNMDIYNRWGELIYTVHDMDKGWDGNIKNLPAPQGQYVYKITYQTFLKSDEEYLMGGFYLIR